MVRALILGFLILLSTPTWADLNSDIQQCLNGQLKQGQSKSQCVSTAIDSAQKTKQTQAFGVYSQFESQNLAGDTSGGGGGESLGPVGPQQPSVGPIPQRPAAPTTPQAPAPAPQAPANQPQTAPKAPGGIQYF